MKTDVLNKMIEKAKGKKNGVYKMNGHHYLVKNGVVKLVSDFGDIVQPYGHFVAKVGSYQWNMGDAEGKKMLMQEGELSMTVPEGYAMTVPKGYAIVPIEPTESMIDAGFRADSDAFPLKYIYQAMIKAAQEGE